MAVFELPTLEQEPVRAANRRRAYTPEECTQLARVWEQATGAPPAQKDWNPALRRRSITSMLRRIRDNRAAIERFEQGGYPSDSTVRKLFGSWNAFLHASGWEPRDSGRPPMRAAAPPRTPTREQIARRVGREEQVHPVAFGRDALATLVRRVLLAEQARDTEALKQVLLSGAEELLRWHDHLDGERP